MRPASSPFLPPPGARRPATGPGRRFATAPAEGWISLALLVCLGLIAGWSIDDARWVIGRGSLTDFLPLATGAAIAWGILGAKAGWSAGRTHLLGAVLAALVVPLVIGLSLPGEHGSVRDLYVATAHSSVEAWLDLAWRGRTVTSQYGHFLLILGLLGWATGQAAGYAAFGHRRPLNAVLLLGFVLVANMSITIQDHLPALVVFTAAALLFLVRMNAFSERRGWARRRIGDPRQVSAAYLRGGLTFVAGAVLASLVLTAGASSAPLAGTWSGIDQGLIGLGQQLQRYLPGGGPGTRITGVAFGSSAPITGRWVTDATPALSIAVPVRDAQVYYWRAVAFDHYDLTGWSLGDPVNAPRDAGAPLLPGTLETPVDAPFVRKVEFSVRPLAFHGSNIVGPGTPVSVNVPSRITLVGDGQAFAGLDLAGGIVPYRVTAVVPITTAGDPNALTENKLRSAGRDYPPEISRSFLDLPQGSAGPDLRRLAAKVAATTPGTNPYDIAKAMVTFMRSSTNFTYTTDVTDISCPEASVAECFARFRRGFCQYYATTMVVLLRLQGIPARMAEGFLPGERDPLTGIELIRYSNSHAWVEAYFPGFGWVDFDPTGGGVAQLGSLPAGDPVPSASPSPSSSAGASPEERDPPPIAGQLAERPDPPGSGGAGNAGSPLAFVAAVLFVLILAAALVVRRRERTAIVDPESVYGGIVRLAARLGFGPRPTETVYEYSAALAKVLPDVRPQLALVARAKVEVAYGRREPAETRLETLRAARARLRVGLLRLLLRRRGRG